ncbi:hypothetical protein H4P12_02205 [Paracoccus sp. 11-3]|uniref:Uncharacterized protein n=1 Tax=Paracoccus amoyensis TaxID=2760093 RepID=A0A926GDU2_9RHOB|nr:hypothetical protein [Paracoccus amoyensis]MBC9245549.1 hypothetical protein [Paracoccus amoyensis]
MAPITMVSDPSSSGNSTYGGWNDYNTVTGVGVILTGTNPSKGARYQSMVSAIS